MIDLHNFSSNTGRDINRHSGTAQGDFPTKVRTIETRDDFMEPDLNREGSLEAGTSMEQGLYELDPDINVSEGMYHGVRSY